MSVRSQNATRVSCRRVSTHTRKIGASRAAIRARGHGDSAMSEDDDYAMDENRTPYYTQTERKFLEIGQLEEGACFGEIGVMLKQPRMASVVAASGLSDHRPLSVSLLLGP